MIAYWNYVSNTNVNIMQLYSLFMPKSLQIGEEAIMTFYEALCIVILSTPNDKLIILNDFNACK